MLCLFIRTSCSYFIDMLSFAYLLRVLIFFKFSFFPLVLFPQFDFLSFLVVPDVFKNSFCPSVITGSYYRLLQLVITEEG